MENKERLKKLNTEDWEDIQFLYEVLDDLKTFDLYVIYLMFKNELLKRGYKTI